MIVYAHGNRLNAGEAISRCLKVYRNIAARRSDEPVDWVLFSWPAAKSGNPIRDARIKADRTDAHGLYLGWLLRQHYHLSIPTGIISYSFGGRITTGALHAMAGGQLDHRVLPGPPVVGAHIDVGLIAPAVDTHWLSSRGYHKHATKNLGQMALLYNRRDAVLKRYWLIDKIRGRMALGFTGPRSFAPRADGTKVSVRARDCARFIGLKHDELDYYQSRCQAGFEMARIVDGVGVSTLSVIE